jgi:signal peptidase
MTALVRRTAGTLLTTLALALLMGVLALFWLVKIDGWTIQTVATGSMAPTVPTGSVILSRPVTARDVRVDDIIVFVSPGGSTVAGGEDGMFRTDVPMLITHRVVAIEGSGASLAFRTKGDANEAEDPWLISADALRARTVVHLPHVGAALASHDLRRKLYLIIAAAGLAVIAAESRSIKAELCSRRHDSGAGRPSEPSRPDAADPPADAGAGPVADDAPPLSRAQSGRPRTTSAQHRR